MVVWLLGVLTGAAAMAALVATGSLHVRRYSAHHVTAHLAVARRGLFFSRTPDGVWWRLRLRPCDRRYEDRSSWPEPPPDAPVREPRRPLGPAPSAGAVGLAAPRYDSGRSSSPAAARASSTVG
jgi:hypothetical protein